MIDITKVNLNPTPEQFLLEGQNDALKKSNHYLIIFSIILTGATSAAIYSYYVKNRNYIRQSSV
jgi:hypothetical protein